MRANFGACWVLACVLPAFAQRQPEGCKLPAEQEQELRNHPSAKTYNAAGTWFAKQGKLNCAVGSFEQAIRLDPQSAVTHDKLGEVRARAQQWSAAAAEFRLALKFKPAMASAHAGLGTALQNMGKTLEAEAEFHEALKLEPTLAPALVGLGIIRANSGDTAAAEKLFRQATAADVHYESAHLDLALVLAREQRFSEAEAEAEQAMKLAPEDRAAMAAAGRVKARLGKSAEAIALLRRVVALEPDSSTAHLDLGMVLAESYDLPGALAENDEAIRLGRGDMALAHLNRGRVLFDLGRREEARPDLETAVRLAPQMPEPYYFLAMIAKQGGDYKAAISHLQAVVRLQPRNATAWHMLGQSLEHESQMPDAISAWKQAVAIDPDYRQPLISLSRALRASDPAEAARYLERYKEIEKNRRVVDQASALGNDALAAGAAHDWQEAIETFQRAIELCGECSIQADLHKKLGLTQCQMGDLDNGEKELRVAQSLKPDDPDVGRALGRIAAARARRAAAGEAKSH